MGSCCSALLSHAREGLANSTLSIEASKDDKKEAWRPGRRETDTGEQHTQLKIWAGKLVGEPDSECTNSTAQVAGVEIAGKPAEYGGRAKGTGSSEEQDRKPWAGESQGWEWWRGR